MDFTMDWNILSEMSNEQIIHVFDCITKFDLYTCSLDWRDSKEYILKLRGTSGDVIVNWI